MHISNVYDFLGPHGYFFNGIEYNLIQDFQSLEFIFNKKNVDILEKKHGTISCFSNNIVSENKICISDVDVAKKDVIYFYNLHTNGNLKHFLGMNKKSEDIKKSGFGYLSNKAIEYVRNVDNFYITIYSGLENEVDKYDILKLYKECSDYNIPRNKIIFFSNIINAEKIINLFKNKFKITNQKDFIFYNFNEQLLFKGDELKDYSNLKSFIQKDEINISKPNKCLFLNRRLRPHRLILLSLLTNDNLLDDNLVSFDLEYDDINYFEPYITDNHYIRVDEYFDGKDIDVKLIKNDIRDSILNGFKKLQNIKKKSLDVSDLSSIEGRHFEVDSKNLYKNSYFSIVGETEFFDDWKDYTTEKVLKPIQQLHPFVIIGRPHILEDLKSYGFKTFSEFWDESYDLEENNALRIDKVYSIIKYLINKPFLEWEDMYIKLKPILIHNQQILANYAGTITKPKIEKKIIKLLSNESIQNYQRIL